MYTGLKVYVHGTFITKCFIIIFLNLIFCSQNLRNGPYTEA